MTLARLKVSTSMVDAAETVFFDMAVREGKADRSELEAHPQRGEFRDVIRNMISAAATEHFKGRRVVVRKTRNMGRTELARINDILGVDP